MEDQKKGLDQAAVYEIGKDGHFGACQAVTAQGHAPNPDIYTGPWANICQGLHGTYREILSTYWQASLRRLEDEEHDYKQHQLPLARIKKVMKADPEVKMISAEAPILFAKGCDVFITELTMRAWIHAEENKRRTLQRSDIAAALTKSDMFDFLIDIVPREEAGATHAKRPAAPNATVQTQQQMPQTMAPPPLGPGQAGGPGQGHAPQEYGYVPTDQDYRPPPQMYQPSAPGDPNAAYSYPSAPMLNDPSMYGGYSMPPQSMYQMQQQQPPPLRDPQSAVEPSSAGFGRHDEVDAAGERDYEV